jgi:hypothetical protein
LLRLLTSDNRREVVQVVKWPKWLKVVILAFLKWFLDEIGKEAPQDGA